MDKHAGGKKDPKGKAGQNKSAQGGDEPPIEESFSPDFPEPVVFASFIDLPANKISASSEAADRRERLRKYNLYYNWSSPMWITCTRDIPERPPPPPEKIPVWKTIRQRKKHVLPSDEPIYQEPPKPDQWVEVKSPFIGIKPKLPHIPPLPPLHRTNSRFSRIRSARTTDANAFQLEEKDENRTEEEEMLAEAAKLEAIQRAQSLLEAKLEAEKLEAESVDSKQTAKSKGNKEALKVKKEKTVDTLMDDKSKTSRSNVAPHQDNMTSGGETSGQTVPGDNQTSNADLQQQQSQVDLKPAENVDPSTGENTSCQKHKIWMDFDDFYTCFKSIVVYHKPSSYKFNEKYSDLKQVMPVLQKEKKKEAGGAGAGGPLPPLLDDKSPRLLFVDSLSPIEIIVSLSCMSRWYEQRIELPERGGGGGGRLGRKMEDDSMNEISALSAGGLIGVGGGIGPFKEFTTLQQGQLMAEHYSWKSLVTGQPLLRINTSSIRSTFLYLPPGRHVLRVSISTPIGHHVHVMSNTKFCFGDEDDIMPKLTDDSCRFVDQALQIFKSVSESIKNFTDKLRQKESFDLLMNSISPLNDAYLQQKDRSLSIVSDDQLRQLPAIDKPNQISLSKRNLYDTFMNAFYDTLKKALGDSVDHETAFAWKVFLLDTISSSSDVFTIKDANSAKNARPETSSTGRGSAKKQDRAERGKGKAAEAAKEAKEQGGSLNTSRMGAGEGSTAANNATSGAGGVTSRSDREKIEKQLMSSSGVDLTVMSEDRAEYWKTHVPTAFEHMAAVRIQAGWRGYYVRKMFQSRTPGNPKNLQVAETLKKSWSNVEQNLNDNALHMFRHMFKLNPRLTPYYPFYKDEWNRISYSDYNGTYPEQGANTWFIIFRDIFYVSDSSSSSSHPQLANLQVPRCICQLNNYLLKVIDNDTYKELPKVFNRVAPYSYPKNRKGYTIMAEARTPPGETGCTAGRWRLRLIGSTPNLLTPRISKSEIISMFDYKEVRDYYIPNEHKTIMRYKVQVSDDHLTSFQLITSKPDVYVKLTIFDNGQEVLNVTGKGGAVIPAFIFIKDRTQESNSTPTGQGGGDRTSRPASKNQMGTGGGGAGPTKSSSKGSHSGDNKSESTAKAVNDQTKEVGKSEQNVSQKSEKGGNKTTAGASSDNKHSKANNRSSSANSNEKAAQDKASRSSSRQSNLNADLEDEELNKPHRYIIEATVLKDSWPLTPTQWNFVSLLKEHESNESKVFASGRAGSPSKDGKSDGRRGGNNSTVAKGKGGKKGTPAPGVARPASSNFDPTRAYWVLRWVSDAIAADVIEVKKDTDRLEEIRAMKKAWESHEPGRFAKATIARGEFLKSHLIKQDGSPLDDDEFEKITEEQEKQREQHIQQLFQQKEETTGKGKGAGGGTAGKTVTTTASAANKDDAKSKGAGGAGAAGSKQKKDSKLDRQQQQQKAELLQQQAEEEKAAAAAREVEEAPTNRPPTPPKPKVVLPPIDVSPFVRTSRLSYDQPLILKDELYEKDQDQKRKLEYEEFAAFKEQMTKFRDEERKYRLFQKIKQIEEYEGLQVGVDEARKQIYEPREAFRQIFLEAERKRLEELAAAEAALQAAAAAQSNAKDKKGKKSPAGAKAGKKK